MRTSLLRSAAVACCGLAVVATVLTGCGSDDESTAATSTKAAAATSAAPATADAATAQAITKAYTTFFDGSLPAEQRAAVVQNSDAFLPVLKAQAAAGNSGTTVTVAGVKTTGANSADVSYTLLMGGNPVLPDQTGQAVSEGGAWKVAAATFCALLAIQGGTSPAC
ncbi:hypothetical protein ACTD5D_28055 [Nocardia takedensis]|uniref:hypothetical protein n=1 Tax=Nocardia takedensis TaxID=259390 RepID=UPI0002F9F540|nr:hypothetical protein [Nocardia takedensis]